MKYRFRPLVVARAFAMACVVASGGCSDSASTGADAGAPSDSVSATDAKTLAPLPATITCPGGPGCKAGAQAALQVGVASRAIMPTGCEKWVDKDGNTQFNERGGDTYTDANNNKVFDACYLAGFSYSQPSNGKEDDVLVRALVLRQDDSTVAFVVADVIGLFYDELVAVRKSLDPKLGVDLVVLGATHNHNAPDTIGLWGPTVEKTGVPKGYLELVRAAIRAAIGEAVKNLKAATVTYASVKTVDAKGSTEAYVSDTRDPVVIDPTMTLLRFDDKATPAQTIATLIQWAHHPESRGGKRTTITSDFVHHLREGVEKGVRGKKGIGGTAVYFNGPLGGQIGPGRVKPLDAAGKPVLVRSLAKAKAIGESVAVLALDALAKATDKDTAPKLQFATATMRLLVENRFFHTAYLLKVINRDLRDFDKKRPLSKANPPYVHTEVASIRLGKAHMVTAPVELHPELWIGYDKKHAYNWPQLDPKQTKNVPDLGQAPKAPYIRDALGGTYKMFLGCTQDFLGYMMPEYNFVLHKSLPYVLEADGDHYEETRSAGPQAGAALLVELVKLAKRHAQ